MGRVGCTCPFALKVAEMRSMTSTKISFLPDPISRSEIGLCTALDRVRARGRGRGRGRTRVGARDRAGDRDTVRVGDRVRVRRVGGLGAPRLPLPTTSYHFLLLATTYNCLLLTTAYYHLLLLTTYVLLRTTTDYSLLPTYYLPWSSSS